MKTEYIDGLYNDLNVKVETVLKYVDILKSSTISTTEFLAKYVKLHEQLYSALAQSRQPIAPDSQFAIEQQPQLSAPDGIDIKHITQEIANNTPLVEYKFETLLRNLQFTSQSLQNYQDLTNQILESWSSAIENIQQ